jgi:hypothetical protein
MSISVCMLANVHNAHQSVKAKRTAERVHNALMAESHILTAEAQRLRLAREKRGFKSAKDAAEFFGWSYNSYAQHENGLRGIKKAAEKYATAYRVSRGWLLTGEGAGPGENGAISQKALEMARALARIPPERQEEALRFLEFLGRASEDKTQPDPEPPEKGAPKGR